MLTEGVHSVVDSTNQLLLMWGRRQPRAARQIHPFGYGRELYFWSFVVAVLVFSLGAGVSVYEGIIHIAHPEQAVSPIVAYVVLLVAFLLEGWSTLEAFKEFRRPRASLAGSRRSGGRRTRRRSSSCSRTARPWPGSSPPQWACFSSQITGDPFYDGAASVVIGVILGLTAILLAYESKGLLIGEAADPEMVGRSTRWPAANKGIVGVGHVLTSHSAPDQITAMLNVDFEDDDHRTRSRTDRPDVGTEAQRALAGMLRHFRPADGRRGRRTSQGRAVKRFYLRS